jgi:hypothetical protein
VYARSYVADGGAPPMQLCKRRVSDRVGAAKFRIEKRYLYLIAFWKMAMRRTGNNW